MQKNDENFDYLGYYLCDGIKFYSKIDACIYSTKSKKPIKWWYHDHIFDSENWLAEPSNNLNSYYLERAKQIREKYDYILLAFSGGGDSNNILETFLRNNIFIDEVVTNKMHDKNQFLSKNTLCIDSWNEPAEFDFQTLPRLKELSRISPKTKITVLDLSNEIFNFLSRNNDERWLSYTRDRLNVSQLMQYNYIKDLSIRKNFDKGKKVGLILGIEKPRVYIKNGVLKFALIDKAVNTANIGEFLKDYNNLGIEYFYTSPDSVHMMIKQCHTIKNWLKDNPNRIPDWTISGEDDFILKHRLIHEPMYRYIIYDTWKATYWQANKSTSDWWSEIDYWFTEGHHGTREFNIWKSGLDYIERNASDYLTERKGKIDGLKAFVKIFNVADFRVENKS